MKFILDTNFLMLIGAKKVDVFAELKSEFGSAEFFTTSQVLRELELLSKGKGKSASYAKLALSVADKMKVLESSGSADYSIILEAAKSGFVICTQDKKLIRKLKDKSVKTIYFSPSKRKLIMM